MVTKSRHRKKKKKTETYPSLYLQFHFILQKGTKGDREKESGQKTREKRVEEEGGLTGGETTERTDSNEGAEKFLTRPQLIPFSVEKLTPCKGQIDRIEKTTERR